LFLYFFQVFSEEVAQDRPDDYDRAQYAEALPGRRDDGLNDISGDKEL
jgi:hypothetical protein